MVESSRLPGRRVVALRACLGKSGLHMVRTGRPVEIGQVAACTIRRRSYELPIYVAACAGHRRVRSGQGKVRERSVVEQRARPGNRGVTGLAVCGKGGLHMVGIRGPGEISHVAAIAIGRCALKLASHVAGGAVELGMRSRQSESCELQMVKSRPHPGVHGMAGLARGGKLQRLVIGALCGLEIADVAAQAVRTQSGELRRRASRMALLTLDDSVSAN